MNEQQVIVASLAFLIDRLGYRVPGGMELLFLDEKLNSLPPEGQVTVARHADKPGWCLRYIPNRTITVEAREATDDSGSGLVRHTKADDPLGT